jgi:hypothetical protein
MVGRWRVRTRVSVRKSKAPNKSELSKGLGYRVESLTYETGLVVGLYPLILPGLVVDDEL